MIRGKQEGINQKGDKIMIYIPDVCRTVMLKFYHCGKRVLRGLFRVECAPCRYLYTWLRHGEIVHAQFVYSRPRMTVCPCWTRHGSPKPERREVESRRVDDSENTPCQQVS